MSLRSCCTGSICHRRVSFQVRTDRATSTETIKPVRIQRVRAFLLDRFGADPIRMSAVKPADVVRFMAKYTEDWTAPSKRAAGDSLRSYFRFRAFP